MRKDRHGPEEIDMGTVVLDEWMGLDGVVQSPSAPDEDPSGGFTRGGWHPRYFDDLSRGWVAEGIAAAGGYLFGRRTYEIFAGYWPHAGEEMREVAEPLNTRPKYVASTTLAAPLGWQNSTLLDGDVAAAVAELKRRDTGELHVIGSIELARTLLAHDLVDTMRLMIDPVLVGDGRRLFGDLAEPRSFRLADSQVATTGAILATYTRSDG
jgi:dihydrofolate reductase